MDKQVMEDLLNNDNTEVKDIGGDLENNVEKEVTSLDNVANDVKKHIDEEAMNKWKEEYKSLRVDFSLIRESMEANPIDPSSLEASFDVKSEFEKVK